VQRKALVVVGGERAKSVKLLTYHSGPWDVETE
jgi:hypothetical protein